EASGAERRWRWKRRMAGIVSSAVRGQVRRLHAVQPGPRGGASGQGGGRGVLPGGLAVQVRQQALHALTIRPSPIQLPSLAHQPFDEWHMRRITTLQRHIQVRFIESTKSIAHGLRLIRTDARFWFDSGPQVPEPSYQLYVIMRIRRGTYMENRGPILMQRFEVGRLLGQGNFAKVYYARNLRTGQSVAIKMIDKEKVFRVGGAEQIKREISVMRLVRHPNIVRLFEVMASKSKIYFVMEYVKGGELFDKVAKGRLQEDMYRKIGGSEFRFPSWFSSDVRKLISKILDPNPSTRISMSTITESKWFRKETDDKKLNSKSDEVTKLNAFDIITLLSGFNLSGLFREWNQDKEALFTSNMPPSTIISKFEDLAKHLKLKIKKKDTGVIKIERLDEGKKGVLAMDAEIFEITPLFRLVEIKKSNGDTVEYQKLIKEGMRPALKDIVWTWQERCSWASSGEISLWKQKLQL
ncbi:unnamed protein product, partial [Musa acuminata subsp. burmannicoides]